MLKTLPILALVLAFTAAPVLAADVHQDALDTARAHALANPQSEEMQFELLVALARSPFMDEAWDALTRLQGLDRDYAWRIRDRYEARVVAEPGDAEARLRLAFGYYFTGDREAARKELERAAAIAPGDPWIWDYLGFLQFEINKSDWSSACWKRALEADSSNALAHYLLGQLLYRQGHQHDAHEELMTAAKLRAASPLHP